MVRFGSMKMDERQVYQVELTALYRVPEDIRMSFIDDLIRAEAEVLVRHSVAKVGGSTRIVETPSNEFRSPSTDENGFLARGEVYVILEESEQFRTAGTEPGGMEGQVYIRFPPEVNAFLTGNPRETEEAILPLFKELSPEEEAEFRAHTRANYVPGSEIKEIYHPVWQDEARKMNREAMGG